MDDGSYGASRTSSWTWPYSCCAYGLIWQRRHSGISVGARCTISSRCRRCANVTCLPAAVAASSSSNSSLSVSHCSRRGSSLSRMSRPGTAACGVASRYFAPRHVVVPVGTMKRKKKKGGKMRRRAEKRSPVSIKRLLVPPPRRCRISSLEITSLFVPLPASFALSLSLCSIVRSYACRQQSDVKKKTTRRLIDLLLDGDH